MANIAFNKEIEKLAKEGIDGNGFISWEIKIDELLNLLMRDYLNELNALDKLKNKINDNDTEK